MVDLNKYLKYWIKKPILEEINPLNNEGILFSAFPHLENLVIEGKKTFYKNNLGEFVEKNTYILPFNIETSPADIFINWMVDLEVFDPTEEQIILFNKIFGKIFLKESIFLYGIPLNYLAFLISDINLSRLNYLPYNYHLETTRVIEPFFYYQPYEDFINFDKKNQKDKLRPIKTTKIIRKGFLIKFFNDIEYREKFFNEINVLPSSYKSSFDESGLFTTGTLKDFYKMLSIFGFKF